MECRNYRMKEKSERLKRTKMTRYLFVQCSQSVHRPSLYIFSGSQAPYTHANGHMPSPGSPRPVTIKQAKRFLRFRLHVLASARLFAMASAATDISDEQILPSHPPIASWGRLVQCRRRRAAPPPPPLADRVEPGKHASFLVSYYWQRDEQKVRGGSRRIRMVGGIFLPDGSTAFSVPAARPVLFLLNFAT
jgi:hypothetical protein